jgi:hypothetical protein
LHSQRKSFAGFSLEIVSLETDKSMNLYTDMKKQNAFLFAASDGKIRVTLASEKASKDFDKDILTLCVSPGNCLLSFEKGISIFYHVILNRAYVNGLPAIYLGYII